MHELPSGAERLVLQGDFPAFTPQELFDYWTTPTLITQWWPTEAEIVPGPGGSYCFIWPAMGWVLQGTYEEFIPRERLVFTWRWSHDPVEEATRRVELNFAEEEGGGTLLTITHGTYGDSEAEQAVRQGHLEGWIHFCMKLAGLREGIQDSTIMEEPDPVLDS